MMHPPPVLLSPTPHLETHILKVASEGFRLSLLLNAAGCQISQSGIEIHSIAKGVSLFALALKEVGSALDKPGELNPSHEAVGKIREIANQGEGILNDIGGMLERLKGMEPATGEALLQRVKQCFKRHYVTYLLAQLETLKLSLIVVLQVLRLGKLNGVNGACTDSIDEAVAQGRAEAQNMIIVRYHAAKRLNGLWELVEREALEADHDQPINSHKPRVAASTAKPSRLLVPSLGGNDSDPGLASAMGRTARDMVLLSEKALNQLLSTLVLDENRYLYPPAPRDSKAREVRKAHFSSDSDESDDSLDFDNGIHGYYLEGPTTDWRKPHSQEARQHAAQLRRKYAAYQAHAESDSEDSQAMSCRASPNTDDDAARFSDEEGLKRHGSQRTRGSPTMGYGTPPSRNPRHGFNDKQSSPRHAGYMQSPYPHPHLQRQQQSYQKQDRGVPHSAPVTIPPKHSARGIPTQPDVHHQVSPPHSRSPQAQYRHQPPARLYSSNTNHSYQRPPSHRKPDREDAKGRHKSLADGAVRGLMGVSAIAGFMDALEAFSAL